jgi:hemoglobin
VVRRSALRFYEIMDSDPGASHIRTMHERDLTPIRQLLFEFLSGWLGGAPLYFQATRASLHQVGSSSL